MSQPDDKPYAICLECPARFENWAAMLEHGKATLTPTGEAGATARGHRSRVVNPTPEEREEREENRVRSIASSAVSRAMDEAAEEIARDVERGVSTDAQARDALGWHTGEDFLDAYVQWVEAD